VRTARPDIAGTGADHQIGPRFRNTSTRSEPPTRTRTAAASRTNEIIEESGRDRAGAAWYPTCSASVVLC